MREVLVEAVRSDLRGEDGEDDKDQRDCRPGPEEPPGQAVDRNQRRDRAPQAVSSSSPRRSEMGRRTRTRREAESSPLVAHPRVDPRVDEVDEQADRDHRQRKTVMIPCTAM